MKGARDMAHDEPKLRLKVATRKAVKAVHGTQLAGEIVGARQQRMSDCQLANTPEFLRIDEVVDLEDAARGSHAWPQITRALARHHGFELLPLPGCAPGDSDWHRALADVSREAGDAVAKICGALADDGKVSATEIRDGRVVEEIEEAMGKLAALKGLCLAELASSDRAANSQRGFDRAISRHPCASQDRP